MDRGIRDVHTALKSCIPNDSSKCIVNAKKLNKLINYVARLEYNCMFKYVNKCDKQV